MGGVTGGGGVGSSELLDALAFVQMTFELGGKLLAFLIHVELYWEGVKKGDV